RRGIRRPQPGLTSRHPGRAAVDSPARRGELEGGVLMFGVLAFDGHPHSHEAHPDGSVPL
ncbi:hypothetical protein ACFV6U_28715, partial [Streptomyces sp. NPDC059810]|uniref:hypothetical protein n=1 Tax=Streptomyces sp. NPDC059810 TaxID=3346956 RepID=UPI003648A26E